MSDEQRWTESAGNALRREAGELPPELRNRLLQARQAALQVMANGSRDGAWLGAPLGAAMAALLLVVVAGALWLRTPAPEPAATFAADDVTLLLEPEPIELLDDIEFYAWLDGQPETAREP